MFEHLTGNWWAVLQRGIVLVLFSIAALVLPDLALGTLKFLFAGLAIAGGITAIAGLFTGLRASPRWAQLLSGVFSLAAGILAVVWPDVTAVTFLVLVATWAIANGLLTSIIAVRLRQILENE